MRCTKCGKITFDFLESCPSCGQNLKAVRENLGGFIQPKSDLCWFALPDSDQGETFEGHTSTEYQSPVNLAEIDVSDLVAGEEPVEQAVEIDPDALENVAGDEAFQKALDELIPDDA